MTEFGGRSLGEWSTPEFNQNIEAIKSRVNDYITNLSKEKPEVFEKFKDTEILKQLPTAFSNAITIPVTDVIVVDDTVDQEDEATAIERESNDVSIDLTGSTWGNQIIQWAIEDGVFTQFNASEINLPGSKTNLPKLRSGGVNDNVSLSTYDFHLIFDDVFKRFEQEIPVRDPVTREVKKDENGDDVMKIVYDYSNHNNVLKAVEDYFGRLRVAIKRYLISQHYHQTIVNNINEQLDDLETYVYGEINDVIQSNGEITKELIDSIRDRIGVEKHNGHYVLTYNGKSLDYNQRERYQQNDEQNGELDDYYDNLSNSLRQNNANENINRMNRNRRINENELNDFGKHPAYRKVPMTTPQNKEIDKWGRDWNDDSAKGEQEFGQQIGSSAPFTEKVIDMLTDAIVAKLTKKKV